MLKHDLALERIREVRHRISEQYGHDPQKLVNYYIELQKQYRSIDSTKDQQSESFQTPTPHIQM